MNTGSQKQRLLYIMYYFYQQTDSEHGVSVKDIIDYLSSVEITCERKTVYNDIEVLRDFGMDIMLKRGREHRYFLSSRRFQLPELKLLADAVGASRFITGKKSLELIKKLETLTSVHESRELRRQVFVDNRIKTMNESIYYSIDAIHDAIGANRMLQFRYFEYDVNKERTLRHGGDFYEVTPLALIYSGENYYLAAYSQQHNTIVNYRVDRMIDAERSERKRIVNELTKSFSPSKHAGEQFSMFGGSHEIVTMRFERSLTSVVIDRFGRDVSFVPNGDGFMVNVEVEVSPTFFAWVFMFGSRVELLSPASVVDEYRKMLSDALK